MVARRWRALGALLFMVACGPQALSFHIRGDKASLRHLSSPSLTYDLVDEASAQELIEQMFGALEPACMPQEKLHYMALLWEEPLTMATLDQSMKIIACRGPAATAHFLNAPPGLEGDIQSLNYVVRRKLEVIGYIQLFKHPSENGDEAGVEFGIFIAQEFAGRQYASEAVRRFLKLVENQLVETEVYWQCDKTNEPSLHLARKLDFEFYRSEPGGYLLFRKRLGAA